MPRMDNAAVLFEAAALLLEVTRGSGGRRQQCKVLCDTKSTPAAPLRAGHSGRLPLAGQVLVQTKDSGRWLTALRTQLTDLELDTDHDRRDRWEIKQALVPNRWKGAV